MQDKEELGNSGCLVLNPNQKEIVGQEWQMQRLREEKDEKKNQVAEGKEKRG